MDQFDKTDLDIIQELNGNFKANLMSIGKKLKISHATVKYRIDQMLKKDLISKSYTINLNKLKMEFYCLLISCEEKEKIRGIMSSCAKVISYYDTIGEYNLLILLLVEDLSTAEAMMNNCPIFTHDTIKKKNLLPLLNYSRKYREINFNYRKKELNFCNTKDKDGCKDCQAYRNNRCVGCPSRNGYKGGFR